MHVVVVVHQGPDHPRWARQRRARADEHVLGARAHEEIDQALGQADLAYMLGALRKNFLVKLRTERRRPRTWAAGDELEAVAGGSAHSDQAAHEARQVLAAVASLPAEFRDAVIAVDLVGLSYREAARALRVREGTVRSRLFRGRQGVAERLG